jgi:Mg2+ and Co2+ transporter CorA
LYVLIFGQGLIEEISLDELEDLKKPFLVICSNFSEASNALSILGASNNVIEILKDAKGYRRLYPVRRIDEGYMLGIRILTPSLKHRHSINLHLVLLDSYGVLMVPEPDNHLLEYLASIASRSDSIYSFVAELMEDTLSGISLRIERILDSLEELESKMIKSHGHYGMRAILDEARSMLTGVRLYRRLIYRYRDVLEALISKNGRDKRLIYLHDYTLRDVLELVEYSISRIHDFLNINLSLQNLWLTDIMRILTIISTIFIPITFITGVYGMNFDPNISKWNMPELKYPYGYPLTLLAMLAVSIMMILYFKRKKWL